MKTITINITHDEVFDNFLKEFETETSKYVEINIEDDKVVMNVTGTLKELTND